MTMGFPAYHQQQLEVPAAFTPADVLTAMTAAGWTGSISADGSTVECSSGLNLWSWAEKITVRRLGPTSLHIRSQCALPTQCFDWGRNARNVRKLAEAIAKAR